MNRKWSPKPIAVLLAGKLLAGLLLAACAGAQPVPVQRLSSYPGALERGLGEKISLGTEALLDWQHRINLKYGVDRRPTRADPANPLVAKVHRMVRGLPRRIRGLARRHVVALYLLEKDWGTGTTEAVQDADGRWRLGYIALNLTALTRAANAWGSWKESSAFRPQAGHEIRMVLEDGAEDTHQAAIRFIFLHELGHVLGLALGAHGFWDAENLPAATRDSPFPAISWRHDGKGKMISRWRKTFPGFDRLAFYSFGKAKLPLSAAEAQYRALAQTDFPSLYGTTNLFDDFAEAFAIYVHTRLLNKPYRVEVYRDGARRFVYRSCITTGKCPKKVAALEALLGF